MPTSRLWTMQGKKLRRDRMLLYWPLNFPLHWPQPDSSPHRHSYTFIERSIRNGVLEDLDDHKVGPPEGNIRSVGSVVQPAKGTRNKYTEADDRILWNWVNENPQRGGGTDGNEIYKQLEQSVRGAC